VRLLLYMTAAILSILVGCVANLSAVRLIAGAPTAMRPMGGVVIISCLTRKKVPDHVDRRRPNLHNLAGDHGIFIL